MRKIIIAVAVLLALIAGGVFYLFSSLDGIVKSLVEKVGTEVVGSKVSLDKVTLSLADGKAAIAGLRVANPAGYSDKPAISLGAIDVSLDKGSLTGSPIVIKEIRVAAPTISLEVGPQGTNLQALSDQIRARPTKSEATAEAKAEPAKDKAAQDKAPTKVVIDRLAIAQGKVELTAAAIPGLSTGGSATLGEIVLTGIGRDSGGATAEQVARKVADAVLKAASQSSASLANPEALIGDKVKNALPGGAGGAVDAVKGLFGK
jgi:hypothetical protein